MNAWSAVVLGSGLNLGSGVNFEDSAFVPDHRLTGEVKRLEDIPAQAQEFGTAAITRALNLHRNDLLNLPGALGHDDDPIAHVNRLIDVVGDKEHGGAARPPKAEHLILHPHACKGVERPQGFVEKEDFWMINQCPRQGDALGHAAGEMVGEGVSKSFQPDQPHEFIDFGALFAQYSARNEPGLIFRRTVSHGKRFGS